ncbi:WxL protein peptidoglycan domain-containing protein [Paenibacillus graminis]|uniref:WxL protein peptidoglycan domain-containing protein n=1 Tax=Paenibacillus graminis TaxID=189425 RepID=UPI002DBD911F|nr:DUF916 domain-containing protein [Paenibacillus graminis]MEC0167365.1 DUF916 domain-containing protein [Paenibacillus graminis]
MLLGCLWAAGLASADSSFTISPIKEVEEGRGYYREAVKPGDSRIYSFFVKNITDKAINLSVYPADARPAQNGGRSFSDKIEKPSRVGSWITPAGPKAVVLQPGEIKEYRYTVHIPQKLQPGQYVGVVAAEELQPAVTAQAGNGQEAALAIDVLNRTGVQMVMEYKPEQAKHGMSIDAFAHDYLPTGQSQLTIKLSTTGSILEKPTGHIVVRNSQQQVLFKQDYAADSIYGGTTASMVYVVSGKLLLPDTYSVTYEATFSGQTISRTFNFTISEEQSQSAKASLADAGKIEVTETFGDWVMAHWWIVVCIVLFVVLLIILLICLFILLWRRKKKEKKEEDPEQNHLGDPQMAEQTITAPESES